MLALAVVVAACTSVPTEPPSAGPMAIATPTAGPTDPVPVCDPPPAVAGPHLGCIEAVNAARELLPPLHERIASVSFRYSCPDTGPWLPDCAVQMSGVVDFTLVNTAHVIPQPTLRFRVSRGDDGTVVATTVPTAVG